MSPDAVRNAQHAARVRKVRGLLALCTAVGREDVAGKIAAYLASQPKVRSAKGRKAPRYRMK